jgi:hypothetical protein
MYYKYISFIKYRSDHTICTQVLWSTCSIFSIATCRKARVTEHLVSTHTHRVLVTCSHTTYSTAVLSIVLNLVWLGLHEKLSDAMITQILISSWTLDGMGYQRWDNRGGGFAQMLHVSFYVYGTHYLDNYSGVDHRSHVCTLYSCK